MNRLWRNIRSFSLSAMVGLLFPIAWWIVCGAYEMPHRSTGFVVLTAALGGVLVFVEVCSFQRREQAIGGGVGLIAVLLGVAVPLGLFFFLPGKDGEENREAPPEGSVVVVSEPEEPAETRPVLLYQEVERWLRISCYDRSEGWQVLPQKEVAWTTDLVKSYHFPAISFALLPPGTICKGFIGDGHDETGYDPGSGKRLRIIYGSGAKVGYLSDWKVHDTKASRIGANLWLLTESALIDRDGHPGLAFGVCITADVPGEVRMTRLVLEKRFEDPDLNRLVHVCTLPKEILDMGVIYDLHVAFYPTMRPGTRVMDAICLSEDHLSPLNAPQLIITEDDDEVFHEPIPSKGWWETSMEGLTWEVDHGLQDLHREDEIPWDGSGELFVYVPEYSPPGGKPVLVTCRVVLVIRDKPKPA